MVKNFRGSIDNRKTFPYKLGFNYTRLTPKRKSFLANYSLILYTVKVFYLEQFAIYGITQVPSLVFVPREMMK